MGGLIVDSCSLSLIFCGLSFDCLVLVFVVFDESGAAFCSARTVVLFVYPSVLMVLALASSCCMASVLLYSSLL
ncbi:hypothetical protein DFP72DRAFT_900306, partial [Ephemerocybe angulata]